MIFTQAQVQAVAEGIDAALRATNHPDLPLGPIKLALLIQGAGEQVAEIKSPELGATPPGGRS
jgi:hypothetical protein